MSVSKRRERYVLDFRDQHGTRHRQTMPAAATLKDARREMREIEARIDRRIFLSERKMPLFSDVAKQWLAHKKEYVRESSYDTLKINYDTHFGFFTSIKINHITIAVVEQFVSSLKNKPIKTRKKKCKGEPESERKEKLLSIATIRKILITLNQIMSYAVRHRYLDYNPVQDMERPREQGRASEQKKPQILLPAEIQRFLDAVKDPKYHTLFFTALMTGARQGELLGLRWSDVDVPKQQIHIRRTYNMGRFFTPKTEQSNRSIDMSPGLIRVLSTWKLQSSGRHDDLVFPSAEGTPISAANMMKRYFLPALCASGCPRIRFHDLRHTYASLLLDQNESIKYIQTQLGHSSPTVTINIYSHLLKDQNPEAADRLEKMIFGIDGHKMVT